AQYRKLLVTNRVEEFDLAQENNSNITSVDILDAITFVNEKKTGILPNFEESESDRDQDDIINDDIKRIALELQDMIDKLNLQDPIIAEKFIYIDDEIPIEELSDEEIIAAVKSNLEKDNNIEEDDELELNLITNKEALSSLEKVVQYFKNLPDNISINYTELKVLSSLKSKINKNIQDSAKQSTLDNFM
ncbi:17634_t:CDS:2, partial [Funneliformis caledonium]